MDPPTWHKYFLTIMKQYLDDNGEDDVLMAWRSLTFEKGEKIQNYVNRF